MMQETIPIAIQLPVRVSQLAEQHRLGQVRMLYRRRLHRFLLWFLPCWLALVTVTLSYDGYKLFLDYSALHALNSTSSFTGGWGQVWVDAAQLLLYIGIFVLGALGVNPFEGIKKRLYAMDNGLIYTNGKKAEVVRWDEVASLFWGKKRGISSICRKDGSTFNRVEGFEKARDISAIIAEAVAERLIPDALAQYQETGKVRFGPLLITREGIVNGRVETPWKPLSVIFWKEIEDVCFEKGRLSIKVSNQWKDWNEEWMQADSIPNPTVCVALIRHILETGDRVEKPL